MADIVSVGRPGRTIFPTVLHLDIAEGHLSRAASSCADQPRMHDLDSMVLSIVALQLNQGISAAVASWRKRAVNSGYRSSVSVAPKIKGGAVAAFSQYT